MADESGKTFRVTFQMEGKEAVVPEGTTILEACRRAGIAIDAVCAGRASAADARSDPRVSSRLGSPRSSLNRR